MRIPTLIVDDLPRHYKQLKKFLLEFDDILHVVGNYFSEHPFDSALTFINDYQGPMLLILDWDLEEGEKNGKKLFEFIGNKNCFAIFCSTWTSSQVINSVSMIPNAVYLAKGIPDILPKQEFIEILDTRIKPHFEDLFDLSLNYYLDGSPNQGRDNIGPKSFLCKNIIAIKTNGHQYYLLYSDTTHVVEYSGPCKTAKELSTLIVAVSYPHLQMISGRPVIWCNRKYYNLTSTNKFCIVEHFKAKVPPDYLEF